VSSIKYDNNKPKVIRYVIYSLAVIFVALLQNSAGALPEILGARALLAVPACVVIAMHEREIASAVFGAFTGVILDICTGTDGFNTFTLMVLSAVCSLLVSHLMQNNIVASLVLNAGAIVAYELLYIVVNYIFGGADGFATQLITFYLPSFIYTMIFVPVLYYLFRWAYTSHKTADE
jgi:rod shape-determining protein MreD